MMFVCKECVEGDHCGRDADDTWCDCQHRDTPRRRRGDNGPRGDGLTEEGQRS